MLANVVTSAASQRFGAPDDAHAARGTSYAQTFNPGWTPAFRGLLRAAAVPHQQLVPPPRRPAAPRWLRERATSGVDWGWGGGGILASCPRWPPHRDGRADRAPRGASEFWFPGAKKGQPASFIAAPACCGGNRSSGAACLTRRTAARENQTSSLSARCVRR